MKNIFRHIMQSAERAAASPYGDPREAPQQYQPQQFAPQDMPQGMPQDMPQDMPQGMPNQSPFGNGFLFGKLGRRMGQMQQRQSDLYNQRAQFFQNYDPSMGAQGAMQYLRGARGSNGFGGMFRGIANTAYNMNQFGQYQNQLAGMQDPSQRQSIMTNFLNTLR
jgi:hypothetical protein